MNKSLNPGPASLAVIGILVMIFLSLFWGIGMIIGAIVWHFGEQPKELK